MELIPVLQAKLVAQVLVVSHGFVQVLVPWRLLFYKRLLLGSQWRLHNWVRVLLRTTLFLPPALFTPPTEITFLVHQVFSEQLSDERRAKNLLACAPIIVGSHLPPSILVLALMFLTTNTRFHASQILTRFRVNLWSSMIYCLRWVLSLAF